MSLDVEAGVIALFAEHADKALGPITAATPLEALDIHSLELTGIVMDVEDKYGVEIDLSTVDSWQSFNKVGDLVDAVKALLSEKARS
ncbi:MAG: acyl carrier protein [Rhizobiaceae bacterium]